VGVTVSGTSGLFPQAVKSKPVSSDKTSVKTIFFIFLRSVLADHPFRFLKKADFMKPPISINPCFFTGQETEYKDSLQILLPAKNRVFI
jgi:hypothetical protein